MGMKREKSGYSVLRRSRGLRCGYVVYPYRLAHQGLSWSLFTWPIDGWMWFINVVYGRRKWWIGWA